MYRRILIQSRPTTERKTGIIIKFLFQLLLRSDVVAWVPYRTPFLLTVYPEEQRRQLREMMKKPYLLHFCTNKALKQVIFLF